MMTYIDRYTGKPTADNLYAGKILNWLYNSYTGYLVNCLMICRKPVSAVYGWYHKTKMSRGKLKKFVRQLKMDISGLESYATFNDFFTRPVDKTSRPVIEDCEVCVAPADGRVFTFPEIRRTDTFRIKNTAFNLPAFLADEDLVSRFDGGSLAIIRLYLNDYHHFCFPDSGKASPPERINGKYHATSPYTKTRLVPWLTENVRTVTRFESENFGSMVMAEVGALTVGSIHETYTPAIRVRRGESKGYFEIGGSTVVLLFEKNRIRFDEDLIANTREGFETYVRLGDSIGCSISEEQRNG